MSVMTPGAAHVTAQPQVNISKATFVAPASTVKSLPHNFSFKNLYIKFNQYFSFLLVYPIFSLFFKVKISGRENLAGVNAPLIIAANHIGWYDSFLFRMLVSGHSRLLPLRFMGTKIFLHFGLNFFYSIGIIPLAYKIFGVFDVVRGEGLEKALVTPKQILAENGVVAIYPEGKMVLKGGIAPFKRGVSALSLQTGVPVLPVAFRYHLPQDLLAHGGVKAIRGRLSIKVGKLTKIPANLSYEEGASYLQKIIEKLNEEAGS
ncbi:MAG: lysophospholipid acyltransferase family protein [Candidatus Pacebacteria bacterium]|nr:lysophospholipid acyltransferase family protein [Candidatus Paceibacterota bacterium]